MATQHYLIVVAGMVDPTIVAGPFPDNDALMAAVPAIVASPDHDLNRDYESEDALFWLDIVDGVPEIGSFSGGFMDDVREKLREEAV